jgi:IS605 OrfB family transposase
VTFTKTLQIDVEDLTKSKKEYVDDVMQQFCTIANLAAERGPSIPYKYVKSPTDKDSPVTNWVKEFRNRDDICLDFQCTQEAVQKALESYQSMKENGNYNSVPQFEDNSIIRLHGRDNIDIKKKDNRFYAVLRVIPYETLWIPLQGQQYQYRFLEAVLNEDMSHGSAELKRTTDGYCLNLTVKMDEEEASEDIETWIGVDLGINSIAVLAVLADSSVESVEFWGGQEALDKTRKFHDKRSEYHRKKLKEEYDQVSGEQFDYMDSLMHRISREVVEEAAEFTKPALVFEDLSESIRQDVMKRDGITGQQRRKLNRMLTGWNYGKLKRYIEYKAAEKGIPVLEINPPNTSKNCNKCGNQGRRPYQGNHDQFYCPNCDYELNADLNAAINIAQRAS